MSENPEHCQECNGKFGSGPICPLCASVNRFGLFLRSPRCPREVGRIALEQLREVHRAVLEAAEDHWIRHPEDTAGVGGLKGKAPSLGVPPPASGGAPSGGGVREGGQATPPPAEVGSKKEDTREGHRHREKSEGHHHQRKHRSHQRERSRSRRREKSKRKSRSATPKPVKGEERSPRPSPREKKRRGESPLAAPVSPGPALAPEREPSFEEEESEEEEASRSAIDPGVQVRGAVKDTVLDPHPTAHRERGGWVLFQQVAADRFLNLAVPNLPGLCLPGQSCQGGGRRRKRTKERPRGRDRRSGCRITGEGVTVGDAS